MNPENTLVRKQVERLKSFLCPAGIFSYLLMCEHLKYGTKTAPVEDDIGLPFVSRITEKITPQGLVNSKLYF